MSSSSKKPSQQQKQPQHVYYGILTPQPSVPSTRSNSVGIPANNYPTPPAQQQIQYYPQPQPQQPLPPLPEPYIASACVVHPLPPLPSYLHFNATEHSFLDLLMYERMQAIKNKEPYHTWEGYAEQFQYEFHWAPEAKDIEEWNKEWEGDFTFWWGLHPDKEMDIFHSRRKYRDGIGGWRG